MNTRTAPRPGSSPFGLVGLLTLIAFTSSADAAPAKKSDKPPAERADTKQGPSSSRAPSPNQSPGGAQPTQGAQPSQGNQPSQGSQPGQTMQPGQASTPDADMARPVDPGSFAGRGQPMNAPMDRMGSRPEMSGAQRDGAGLSTPVQGRDIGQQGIQQPSSARGSAQGGVVPSQGEARTGGAPDASHGRSTSPDRSSASGSSSPDRSSASGASSPSGGSSSHARTPPSSSSRGGSSHAAPASHGSSRPSGTTRSYSSSSRSRTPPAYQTRDHRYSHPSPYYVHTHPAAHRPPPSHVYYRSYYVNYWVHPYYRYQHAATVVVSFGFVVNPWVVTWAPPPRAGWTWTAGWYDAWGYYHPGYWVPVSPAPVYRSVQYVYVPGWWEGNTYVEGFYRPTSRAGWTWVDGYYLSDGSYVPGHWQPRSRAPEGYVWQAGFYDGEQWVEGFWRPEYRAGYTWVNGYFDEYGVYNSGYWMPTQERAGYVWIPGWFDGHQWVEGYWVSESEYQNADVQGWEPEEGYDAGWQQSAEVQNTPQKSEPAPAPKRSSGAVSGDAQRTFGTSSAGSEGEVPAAGTEAAEAAAEEEVPLAIPVEVESEEIQ